MSLSAHRQVNCSELVQVSVADIQKFESAAAAETLSPFNLCCIPHKPTCTYNFM